MTDPSPKRSHPLDSGAPAPRRRWVAGLAVAGVLGAAVSPGVAAVPASAAPVGACRAGVGATADANPITVQRLDMTPLGLPYPTMAGVALLSTRADLTGGGTPRAAALASYLTTGVLDDRLHAPTLAIEAQQYAPPAHNVPDVVATPAVDLAAVRLGAGRLSAHATLTDARRCDTTTGPAATAASSLESADLLAGGGRTLADLGALETGTSTNIVRTGSRSATLAVASAQIADFTLLGGGDAPVTVRTTSQPVLRATAGGSRADSSVEYTAPILEVSIPGVGTRRVQGKTGRLALAMPVDTASSAAAGALAREEGMPLLAPDAFPQLLTALGAPAPAAGAAGGPGAADGRIAILRISIGSLTKEVTDGGVHAKAVSVHLRLALRSCGPDGYGGKDDRETPLADIDLGVLETAASAPVGPGSGGNSPGGGGTGGGGGGAGGGGTGGTGGGAPADGDGGGTGGEGTTGGGGVDDRPTGGAASGGNAHANAGNGTSPKAPRSTAASGSLPLTGDRLALIAGIGTILVVGGRLIMVLARRRARMQDPPL